MDSDSQPPENEHQSTRPKLAGLDPRALMAEGLSPDAQKAETAARVEIPGFEILRPLGAGGMGTVFLANQKSLGREVAIKVLHSGQDFATQFYDRLEREARSMATLSHPNIVAVHDFIRLDDGDAAIVMEAIDGGNLRDVILKSSGPICVERSVALIRQIASGLAAAHEVGIVHRDMKPENVLITRDGTAKVTDFGIALPTGEGATRLTVTGTTLGTVAYMAPEQLNGESVDSRADIYSLGVMLYEMLTGTRPHGNFDSPQAVNPEIPRWAGDATLRALRAEPAGRFQNVEEFVEALVQEPEPSRRVWLAAAAVAVAGLIGAVGFLFINHSEKNLLTDVDLTGATVWGNWTETADGLVSDSSICVLKLLPQSELPAGGYDVEMEFTRISGEFSIALFFHTLQGSGSVEFDAWVDGLSGIQTLDGDTLVHQRDRGRTTEFFADPVVTGQRYQIRLEIRPGRARVFVNGDLKLNVPLTGRELGITEEWKWDTPDTEGVGLGIGSYESQTQFHRITIRKAPPAP